MSQTTGTKKNTVRLLAVVALASSSVAFQTSSGDMHSALLRRGPSVFRALPQQAASRFGGFSAPFSRAGAFRLSSSATSAEDLTAQIGDVGAKLRQAKEAGTPKDELKPLIDELVGLKAQFEEVTGQPFDPPKGDKKKKKPAAPPAKAKGGKVAADAKSDYITPREEDYSQWYQDVVAAAGLVDQSPVRGCMVIKPWGMAIWDALREDLDREIKAKEVQNAYFPLFVSKAALETEKDHVEGFAPEVAWVTKSGDTDLAEPIAVRPTSETIMYPFYANWIRSHRDLPLKLNQWSNVVRWEFKYPTPFLRSREFLWQEGHTAHASSAEALGTAREMLDVYEDVCRRVLAVPVVKGVKSPSERFAGAEETFTIEALMQNGWALQSGTSHFLGQNFARAFDVFFQTAEGGRELVWATSWGVSTRLLGALVMTHSDDAGLVLPPPVAPVQAVIVPITKGEGEETALVRQHVDRMVAQLKRAGVRVKVDDRPQLRPGAKYFEWERKGVPVRIEIGPRDAKAGQCVVALRTGGDKRELALPADDQDAKFTHSISAILDEVHNDLLTKAEERMKAKTFEISTYEEMKSILESGDKSKLGFFLVPWRCDAAAEDAIKDECKATIRCYPLDLNVEGAVEGKTCFYSGEPATHMALFARAF
mmetsp:Transcript_18102/g.28267  ORF Transcript_18102/g.28267 Transcript_18102/m.28267 type:complete len:650 (-) Transcript_18102:1035-2984(-)